MVINSRGVKRNVFDVIESISGDIIFKWWSSWDEIFSKLNNYGNLIVYG